MEQDHPNITIATPPHHPPSMPDHSGCRDSPTPSQSIDGGHEDVCLFIANLPSSFADEELEHHLRTLFAPFGAILTTKAARDKKGRPFCFVQYTGSVKEEVFNQSHYLGGRALRLERSKVKSTELISVSRPSSTAPSSSDGNASIGWYSHGALPPFIYQSPPPMEHLSTAVMVPPSAMHHSHHYYIDGLAQPFGFGLVVEGLNPVVVNRRALFQRFKSFGYILGIDLSFGAIPPSNDGEAPSKASLATAVIYFDTWDAVERAAKSANAMVWFGGPIRCFPLMGDGAPETGANEGKASPDEAKVSDPINYCGDFPPQSQPSA